MSREAVELVRALREGAAEWPYRFEWVDTPRLFVEENERYQRPLSKFFERIVRNFEPALFVPLVVSKRRDRAYAIFDGQTRHAAAKALDKATVPCLVYEGLSVQAEAQFFVLFQTERQGMRALDRFHAKIVGKDAQAIEIAAVVGGHGLELVRVSGRTAPPDAIAAIVALEAVHRSGGAALLDEVLGVLIEAWPAERNRFTSDNMRGLAGVIREGLDDRVRLVEALRRIGTPEDLAKRSVGAREARGLGGGSYAYTARVIRDEYLRPRRRRA